MLESSVTSSCCVYSLILCFHIESAVMCLSWAASCLEEMLSKSLVDFFFFDCLFYSKKPKKPQRRQMNNRLKPLTLAYDGDADM